MSYPNPPQQPPPGGQPTPPGWQPPGSIPGGLPAPAPQKKSRTGLIIGLVVGAVLLLCLCGGLVAVVSGDDTKPTGSDTNATTDTTKKADDADADEPKAKSAKIGTPVRDGKFEFTVTKIERGKTKVGNEYLSKKSQGEFVLVHVTVKNIGDEPQSFFGDDQKLISADGKEYSADTEAAIYLEDSQSLYEEINPGNQVKGIVIFDVPKGAKFATLVLHDSAFSGGVEVKL